MLTDADKQTVATVATTIQVISALADAISGGGDSLNCRNAVIEHKVASCLGKKLAKYITTQG